MVTNTFDFVGGNNGNWKVLKINSVCGEPIEVVSHIEILQSSKENQSKGTWTLTGFTSNIRYAEKSEREKLITIQED